MRDKHFMEERYTGDLEIDKIQVNGKEEVFFFFFFYL